MDFTDPKVLRVAGIVVIALVVFAVIALFLNNTFAEIWKQWSLIKP